MKPYLIHILIVVSMFVSSCGNKENTNISLYRIEKSDFVDEFVVGGFTIPIETKNIVAPYFSNNQIVYLAKDGKNVEAGDTVCILKNDYLISEYSSAIKNKKVVRLNIRKRKVELANKYHLLLSEIENNKADAEMHKFDSLSLLFVSPKQRRIQELELQKDSIERKLLQKKLESFSIIRHTELEQMKIETQYANNQIEKVKSQLNDMVLKAPTGGTLLIARKWNGDKVNVGTYPYSSMLIAQITKTSMMKVKMQLVESDYRRVEIGDSTFFTFDAMPMVRAYGRITDKTPVGRNIYLNRKKTSIKLFDVEATIEKTDSMPQPDFTTNCRIILDYVRDTIVVPNITIFHEDSIDVVFVKTKEGFEKREIKVGKSSSRESIIEKGLGVDEVIALTKPHENRIKSTLLFQKHIIKEDKNDTIISKK